MGFLNLEQSFFLLQKTLHISASLLQDTIFPFLLCHLACCTDDAALAMPLVILIVSLA